MNFKIINTDNYGGDYPNESVLCLMNTDGISVPLSFSKKEMGEDVAYTLNNINGPNASRFYRVVPADYQLIGPFEP